MFEPSARIGHPSGLADWPRPFVFRAAHLDGCPVESGEAFFFDLHVFDMRNPAIAYLVMAFARLGEDGLGPGRGRADLVEVRTLSETGHPASQVYDGAQLRTNFEPLSLLLAPETRSLECARVRFVTPTELKGTERTSSRPEFGILAARIRDRLSTLASLYGDGPLPMDFRGFGERAWGIRMTRCDIHQVDIQRRSSRSGQIHSIGGFVGEAVYEGELAEFAPFLKAARWTGVGRQTVWGKGQIELLVNKEQASHSKLLVLKK